MDMFTFEIDMSSISSNFLYYMRSAELGEDDSYAACAVCTLHSTVCSYENEHSAHIHPYHFPVKCKKKHSNARASVCGLNSLK